MSENDVYFYAFMFFLRDTLVARLNKALNRENSEARMWEYELSKRNNLSILEDYDKKPAVYCVQKMWKEFSHLILLCSFVNQDKPGNEI